MAIRHRLLRDHIVESLRHSILTGELEPGDRLVELELARRFETSQGPVREALQRLATEGLVVLKRHSGTYVAPLNQHELRAICEVRKTVESISAAESARIMDDRQLSKVEALFAEMHAAAERGDRQALIAHDMSFHRYLCETRGSADVAEGVGHPRQPNRAVSQYRPSQALSRPRGDRPVASAHRRSAQRPGRGSGLLRSRGAHRSDLETNRERGTRR